MGSRGFLLVLGILGISLQAELWFASGGYQKTLNLRAAVNEQSDLNHQLRERNAALDAEVINLKEGRDAAEERARTDLGMIGDEETFFQVVPVANADW